MAPVKRYSLPAVLLTGCDICIKIAPLNTFRMRSPKMDDPAFRERRIVPKWPGSQTSALNVLFDFRNMVSLPHTVLTVAGIEGKEPQDLIDELGLGENPLLRFEEAYPEAECENLVALQDPDDVAALNAVVDDINAVIRARAATRQVLEAFIARVNAVYAKYPQE